MKVTMSLVNQPLVTITCYNDEAEEFDIEKRFAKIDDNLARYKRVKSAHLEEAKQRLFHQGAEGAKLFPVEV